MTRLKRPFTVALVLTAATALASCSTTTSPASSLTPSAATSTTPSASASATSSPSPTPPTSPASPATPSGRRIDITVTGKQVTPTPGLVNIAVGESLTISVTSDHNDQLHAHGFEIEKVITAGQPLVITVKGAEPGVYDVELHDPELRIVQVAVR